MEIKIMSFNTQHCLNFYTREIDYDVMAKAIKACNPDIVGLQEMRNVGVHSDYQDQIGILAEMVGMNGCFGEAIKFGGADPYGVGMLSKFPIISHETHPIPDPVERKYKGYYETRTLLDTVVDLGDGKTLNVFVSHFGLNPDEHENAISTVLANVKRTRSVLMGDFNMSPDNNLIAPLFDTFCDTSKAGNGSMLSFPSDKPTVKIDYIFTTSDIKTISAEIPEIIASDHRPHTAIVEVC